MHNGGYSELREFFFMYVLLEEGLLMTERRSTFAHKPCAAVGRLTGP